MRHHPRISSRLASGGAFAIYGGFSLIAQLICLQELRLLFLGHELFLGLSLAAWMSWVGVGSWIARRASDAWSAWAAVSAMPLLILNVLAIRLSKLALGFGLLVGLLPMTLLSIVLLAPLGVVIGSTFTVGLARAARTSSFGAGEAYAWEAAGAAGGGLAYSWVLLGRTSLETMIGLLALPLLLIVVPLSATPRRRLVGLAVVLGSVLIVMRSEVLPWSRRLPWRGYTVVAEHTSRYGHRLLARLGSLTNLFEDGILSANFPDPAAYENLVHLPLLAHPNPSRVLIIGGASTGTLQELLKHPLARIDYVELDPTLLRLLEPFLSLEDRTALHDPRVQVIHRDARRWLMINPSTYDVILLNLPEPMNAQINRLYTVEAFRALRTHLAPAGLVAFAIPSSENYLSPETRYFNAAMYRTVSAVFPSVEVAAGDQLLVIAGDDVRLDPQQLIQRYRQRGLTTREVVPGTIPWQVDARRRALVQEQLAEMRTVSLNRDFAPACYAYAWRVWMSKFVSPLLWLSMVVLIGLIGAVLSLVWRRRDLLFNHPAVSTMFLVGYAGIVYETVLLLAFQALNGHVYWHLGSLFAAFMVGVALGAWLTLRLATTPSPQQARRWLRRVVTAAALEGLILTWALPAAQRVSFPLPWLPCFAGVLLLTGGWLGMAFTLANHLMRSVAPAASETQAGTLYAADLWGAALGALVTGAFLVPLLGLVATLGLTGWLLLAVAAFPQSA